MNIFFFAAAGSIAQLIDGVLGMGFGVTSTSLMVALGANAVVASTAVHVAEIGTTFASGTAHWRSDNVNVAVLKRIAIPGGVGAFAGATFLSNIDLSDSKIFISSLLLVLGFVLLYRNLFFKPKEIKVGAERAKMLPYLGLIGGFIDASGGGGWGPVVTPSLMAANTAQPRKIIGTVSAAEFVVALSATLGFLANSGRIDVDWRIVGALALGGMVMAPVAARISRKMPVHKFGLLVAIAIIAINIRTLFFG